VCGKKPKFVERGHKHPYCSRTCAAQTQIQGPAPRSQGPPPTCLFGGCDYEAKFQGFCDPEHASEAVRLGQIEACEMCRGQPWIGNTISSPLKGTMTRKLCVGCDKAVRGGTQLKELGSKDGKFQSARKQFIAEWTVRNEGLPTVHKVYQVLAPERNLAPTLRIDHRRCRKSLTVPREIRTYYASLVVCDLGTRGPFLCERKACGICSVLRSSFKSFAFEKEHDQGRFGPGIYTFINPKLADNCATSCTTSPYRVIVACDTLVESAHEVTNEDSVFVSISDAINAAYIIIYSM
ncbi:hypothetical protein BDP27DRAFT_1242332, partial [Rhodocollybia butyracea]